MKILIITTYFPPQNSIASLRPYSWAKFWTKAGHEVTVLTTEKKHRPTDLEIDTSNLDILSYPCYIPFSRVNQAVDELQKKGNKNIKGTVLSFAKKIYLMFTSKTGCFSTCRYPDWNDRWAKHVIREFVNQGLGGKEYQLIISTGGPYSVHRIAYAIKDRYPRTKWVVDWRDLWTRNHIYKGLKIFHPIERYLERKFHEHADLITTVSDGLMGILKESTATDVAVIYNGYDPEDYINIHRAPTAHHQDCCVIVYTGVIYEGDRDPTPLFEAIKELDANSEISSNKLKVVFAGPNADCSDLVKRLGIGDYFEYKGFLARQEALQLQADADILLFLAHETGKTKGILTGKLFEYLFTAKEILAIGITEGSAAGAIITKAGAGACLGDNIPLIKAYLREIITNQLPKRKKNIEAYREFSREIQAEKLLAIIPK